MGEYLDGIHLLEKGQIKQVLKTQDERIQEFMKHAFGEKPIVLDLEND
jgi:hypothetical protein